jgi:hypothetical protein
MLLLRCGFIVVNSLIGNVWNGFEVYSKGGINFALQIIL